MAEGIFHNLCWHTNVTEEDGEGHAICVDCGALLQVRLTEEALLKAWKAVYDGR